MRLTSLLIAATLFAPCCALTGPAQAQEQEAVDAVVLVTALRDPAAWPYHPFLAGLDTFEAQRHLAPQGELRFRLRPNKPGLALDNVQVVLEHGDQRWLLDVENASFVIPRLTHFDHGDTVLAVNRRHTLFDQHWPRAEVRTPGLPSHVLRMGDLRLACQVNMNIFKKNLGFWESAALSVLSGRRDWCAVGRHGGQTAQAPFAFQAVILRDGQRTERLAYPHPQLTLSLPLDERGWSDDTLFEFEAAPAVPSNAMPGTPPAR